MPTPTGTIGLSDVNAELNLSPTALITMNDAAVRTLAGVPSGVISMNNLRGKSNRVAISLTISGNTNNYDVYANRGPTYAPGTSDITVTINPGVTVSSTSTGSSAFLVPSAFSPGDTVTVINNGTIVGRGGNGGNGRPAGGAGSAGGSGGPGLNVQRPVTIQNNNRVAGGGGGGGGGGSGINPANDADQAGGGGGGGVASGTGGTRGTASGGNGTNGTSATLTTFGPGGSGAPPGGGPGGNGGTFGSSGSSGSSGNQQPGYSGGGSGAAVTGNPFITWNPTGTRNGPIS